jgi:hypothetical protein
MGFLDDAVKKVRKAAETATEARKQGPAWGSRDPDKADYGKAGAPTPDLLSLVTKEEIEEVTGSSPEGSPRRNGPDGSDVDLGRHVICEWKLDNGDKFLISLGNCTNASMAQLSMERVGQYEKPLAGVGEQGLKRIKKYKTGDSEIGVTALKDNFTLSLTHTSKEGKTDEGPITELLKKALTRL